MVCIYELYIYPTLRVADFEVGLKRKLMLLTIFESTFKKLNYTYKLS